MDFFSNMVEISVTDSTLKSLVSRAARSPRARMQKIPASAGVRRRSALSCACSLLPQLHMLAARLPREKSMALYRLAHFTLRQELRLTEHTFQHIILSILGDDIHILHEVTASLTHAGQTSQPRTSQPQTGQPQTSLAGQRIGQQTGRWTGSGCSSHARSNNTRQRADSGPWERRSAKPSTRPWLRSKRTAFSVAAAGPPPAQQTQHVPEQLQEPAPGQPLWVHR